MLSICMNRGNRVVIKRSRTSYVSVGLLRGPLNIDAQFLDDDCCTGEWRTDGGTNHVGCRRDEAAKHEK